jgi:SulP family sulfate permease
VTIALSILLFSRWVGLIAMPVLAGLLIVIGFRTLKPERLVTVWKTGWTQRLVLVGTFTAALFLPLHYAVLLGVVVAVVLYVFDQSNRITVKALTLKPGWFPVETAPPPVLPAGQVTVLVPYGSLFFAAVPTFIEQLPQVTTAARQAVVILVLRGHETVGSTFLEALKRYAETLHEQDSKLMLTGIDPQIRQQLERTGIVHVIGRENLFMAEENIGAALEDAVDAAEAWIADQPSLSSPHEPQQ